MTAAIDHWEAPVARLWLRYEARVDALTQYRRSMRNNAAALTQPAT
ncbi:hypothetical protein [Tessaracoccus defluvii]|uniref:Uncharacterized protein n=1 Tax=Tessaracoccus defluvii TaxID=1285901 RepID=A0A7H0H236_9ACTN|nr:hypothetical protein [Tessaracoccus defluvii]QNP54602.1 hypothetical protein H9L22_09645 [Tessaracoccus defluvii]